MKYFEGVRSLFFLLVMVVADFFFFDFLEVFILAFRFLSAFADDAVFEALAFPFNDVLFFLLPALFVAFFFCLEIFRFFDDVCSPLAANTRCCRLLDGYRPAIGCFICTC